MGREEKYMKRDPVKEKNRWTTKKRKMR